MYGTNSHNNHNSSNTRNHLLKKEAASSIALTTVTFSFIPSSTPFPQEMKVANSVPFKCKLFHPCRRMLLKLFKLRLRKPVFIKALRFRCSRYQPTKTKQRKGITKIASFFRFLRPSKHMDRVMKLKSFSDAGCNKVPFPSPLTPAYVRMRAANEEGLSAGQQDVEDACRSFENYLVHMIVEEGKMRDLTDVEELLYCWKNLKSPVFIDLVCRFYGELCRDLFSNSYVEDVYPPKRLQH